MLELIVFIFSSSFGLIFSRWCYSNWLTHTSEWREERLIRWLKHPLPTVPKNTKILDNFYELWDGEDKPYCLRDAIERVDCTADEVIKWAIFYTTPQEFRNKDKEYTRV
jgi:hypothetical protein